MSLAHFNFLVSAGLGRNSVARVFKPCMRFKISCCIGNHSVYNKLPDAWEQYRKMLDVIQIENLIQFEFVPRNLSFAFAQKFM